MCRVEIIELDEKLREIALMFIVQSRHQFLGADAFLLGPEHYRCAVGITRADVDAVVAD
jgi:hypothetical protein